MKVKAPKKTDLKASLLELENLDDGDRSERLRRSLQKSSREDLLKLLVATEPYSSKKESKFHIYKPVSAVAMAFHRSIAKIRLILGGNRASKTTTATVDHLISLTGQVPIALEGLIPRKRLPTSGIMTRIVATDFPNGVEKIVKPKVYEWLPPGVEVDYSAELRILTTINTGSKVEFMTNDQEVDKHGGTARYRIQFDEEPDKLIYDENFMRTADENGEIVIAMTPVQGMTWVYDDIYLKAAKTYAMIEDDDGRRMVVKENPEGDPDIEVFILATVDNPHLSREGIAAIGSKITDPDERRMRLAGEFISFSGLIYKAYSSMIHDVDPFHIPDMKDYEKDNTIMPWPVYCALDPHARIEHAYLMCAVDPYGRKFFFEEFFEDLDPGPLANRIMVAEDRYWIIWRLIDPKADEDDPVHHTTLKTELEGSGLYFQKSPKALSSGILRVREGLAIREREGTPGKLRMPEIYFFKNMKRTRWEIARYVWADWRRVREEKSPKQKPKDKDDHMMENLYRVMLREPVWINYEEVNTPIGEWRRCP